MNKQRQAKVLMRLVEEANLELDYLYERVKVCFPNVKATDEDAASKTRAMVQIGKARVALDQAIKELNSIAQHGKIDVTDLRPKASDWRDREA